MKGRTRNALLNVSSNFLIMVIKTVFSFLCRTVFIYTLGKEALGLNGLFTNILSMLSLAELGISSAINFSLYKPLYEKDYEKINSLMGFYKKTYRIVGIIIAIIGVMLLPILKYLINGYENLEVIDIYIIYLLYLLNTVSTYFISYKETLITADQKRYMLVKVESIGIILLNIFQIISLIITKNFIIYLTVQFVVQLFQRIIINCYITRYYREVNFNSKKKIDKKDLSEIVKNIKAMFFHKVGDYCINGTDNLIISSLISLSVVGLYSNYLTIITLLNSFLFMIFNNLAASVGNLIVTEQNEKKYLVFQKMDFIGFILFGTCFVVLLNIFNDFIEIWIGKQYCLSFICVLVILINFYLTGMRVPSNTMKTAAGFYDIDKFMPLIQSIINLITSIFLAKNIGLIGVLLGTLISSLAIPLWQKPYIVYKYIINKPIGQYFKKYILYIIVLTISSFISIKINGLIMIQNLLMAFIIKMFISFLIHVLMIIIFYKNTDELNYIIDLFKNFLLRRKRNA